MRAVQRPLTILAALLIAAGGVVHFLEWNDAYRHLPGDVAGAALVKIGLPVNAVLSLLVAVALVVTLFAVRRLFTATVVAAVVFQLGSLAALVVSREGSLFGWQEATWTGAAEQSKVLEIAALVCLGAVLVTQARRHAEAPPALAA